MKTVGGSIKSTIFFIVVTLCCAKAQDRQASDEKECPASTSQCSLYLAPSSIPNAGLGIYTAQDISADSVVGEPDDLAIPIEGEYKTLPYKGQQRFLSWLGYVWPSHHDAFYPTYSAGSFPTIPPKFYSVDEGLNAASGLDFDGENVFAPGIASLANSNFRNPNIVQKESDVASFATNQDVLAGSELFLDYGSEWHARYAFKHNTAESGIFKTLKEYNEHIEDGRVRIPTEEGKRATAETFQNDDVERKDISSVKKEDLVSPKDSVKQIDWLQKNGACIDNIQRGVSAVAGNGAFAKRLIEKGSVIAPAPLLALKRDDLDLYWADPTEEKDRDVLDTDTVVGHELLLNYAFGHKDSPLLLVPYSPVVNFINHASEANAEIRWSSSFGGDPSEWLQLHPLEVLDKSGELFMEFIALRDILPGEEIFINYGIEWEKAWKEQDDESPFRHEIGVPDDFYPDAWKNKSVVYEVEKKSLKPGELAQMTWAHNGKPVAKNAYRVGLPPELSAHVREFSDERGIIELYEELIHEDTLESEQWYKFNAMDERWFAQRYQSTTWKFNMHYISPWDEAARLAMLRALGIGGFDVVLEGVGQHFGLDNLTVFHTSYMGLSECDNSFTHTDLYATEEKGFNIIFPIVVVNGSNPELDIIGDDANIVVSIHYEYDAAVVMGDWVYHKTSPIDYDDSGDIRVVLAAYCGQIDPNNAKMFAHIYDGEHPAPFMDQFNLPIRERHWGDGHSLPK